MNALVRLIQSRQYRIVRDNYCGYEAQFRTWYLPFWRMVDGCNTSATIEAARKRCDIHATSIVEIYKPNTVSEISKQGR